jgi:tetratricopeptide (TPR) repeat protein
MKRLLSVALVMAVSLAVAPRLWAQTPAGGDAAGSAQNKQDKQPGQGQKPTAAAPQQPSGSNPFPEDTGSVPVLPAATTQTAPAGSGNGPESGWGSATLPQSADGADPVRSPDDPARASASDREENSSSSLKGLEDLLPSPDSDQSDKKRKLAVKQPTHQEAAAEDINVGSYYLDRKNWKAALSRYESALVLDPENPEVYWGLAEAQRHLGELANARANYEKVVEYDPDSHHGKESRKALKDPEIANAQNSAPGQPAAAPK